MQVKQLLNIGLLYFLIAFNYKLQAQELNPDLEKSLEEIVETLENAEEDADYSNLFNDLNELAEHPLNLNTANKSELEKLFMLNPFQIASIIDYRNKVGIIRSVYELGYLPGFREKDIQMLDGLAVCDDPAQKPILKKSSFKYSKNKLLVRYQRVLEKQEGYKEVSDSILNANPGKLRYLGNPVKLYARYGFSAGNHIDAGIVMEKDAGEEFFKGNNKNGFDFYSAHLFYKNEKRLVQAIALGDYHIQLGQGLLVWSSYSGFKTSYTGQLAKRPAIIKRSFSSEENRFLRGAAITLGKKDYSLNIFASHNMIDATIEADSTGVKTFSGYTITGNHNTPLDISKEKQLPVDIAGASVRYDANRLKVGINTIYTGYGFQPSQPNEFYKSYSFTDKSISGISADYRFLGPKSQLFGELAYSNNSLALLNGLLIYIKQGINLGAIYRYYQPGYYSYFSGAFGENSDVANENGFFLGAETRLEKFSLRVYGDVFSFPWLKYQVNVPTEGSEIFAEMGYVLGNTNWYIRYKRQEKPKNYIGNENTLAYILSFINEQYRLNSAYNLSDFVRMQSRIEFSKAGYSDSVINRGYAFIQDISLDNLSLPVGIGLRAAYFNISDYNARIYTYEKDVLYAYSSSMFYGKGWRFACLVKWQPKLWVTFYLKYSLSLYPGEETTGSVLNEISKDHKSEIKSEVIFKF